MLYLIGSGLKPKHLSIEAVEWLKNCDEIFLETYTSEYIDGNVKELEKIIKKTITSLNRTQVEEEFEKKMKTAKSKNIALIVKGSFFFATTHSQILIDAKKLGLNIKISPGSSVFDLIGKTGLSMYKFGETTSIVFWQKNYKPESFYEVIKKNKSIGLHTLCLLDITSEKMMTPKYALKKLEQIENKKETNVLKNSKIIILSRLGANNETIKFGTLQNLKEKNFEVPCSIVVCGKLNEKEKEMLTNYK